MNKIRWNEPHFGEDDKRSAREVLDNNYLNEGPKTRELENHLKNYLGVENVILTTSATAGLFLAVKADSIIRNKKPKIAVPDLTMIATATSVNWAEGNPVLVDVEMERGTIDVSELNYKVSKYGEINAVIPVHILGRSADMEKLEKLAHEHNLTVIEDAAGALSSKYNGNYLGTIGKVGVFSLQSNKIITCGQGGIITTNDPDYFNVMRRLRDFGRINNKEFMHDFIGYNLKFNDLSAAVALSQLKKIDKRKEMLFGQFNRYKENLSDEKNVGFFHFNEEEVPLWVDVKVKDRRGLVDYLNGNDIFPRECWPSIHKNNPYKNQGTNKEFKNSTFLSENTLWLPNGPAITNSQIDFVSEKIIEYYSQK